MKGYTDSQALPHLYVLHDLQRIVIPIAKNASTSLDVAMHGVTNVQMSRNQATEMGLFEDYEVLVLWRQPAERIFSAWTQDKKNGNTVLSLEDYVTAWLSDPPAFDNRVCPQYLYCMYEGRWLPTKILRMPLEVDTFASLLNLPFFPWENASEHNDILALPYKVYHKFHQRYQLDYLIWGGDIK